MRTPPEKIRAAELAKIHLARKQLGLDEETYREVIARLSARFRPEAPVDSAGLMTAAERRALIEEFTRLGWQAAPPRERAEDWISIPEAHPGAAHLRKLLAAAYELERIGAVRANSTSRWLRRFVKKITGCDALVWLTATDANSVIEALKGWRRKWLLKHPVLENQQTAAAIPASAIVKASVFDCMKLVAEPGSPIEGIRNVLALLDSQNFGDAQIAGQVADLIRKFGARARAALLRWNFPKVRAELLWLVSRLAEIDPSIAEGMRAALKPEEGEIESAGAGRDPGNTIREVTRYEGGRKQAGFGEGNHDPCGRGGM
ncbi:MAG: regulatory protein GemA [Candidatus Binataceae bacterium]